MTGPYGVLCLIAMATLFFGSCNATDFRYYTIPENKRFSGGSMSFEFVEAKYDDDIYKVRVTLITGWVLGKGPCGPGCGPGDVGAPTHDRRLQIIANTHDPVIFGNWSTERKRSVHSYYAEYQDITDNVTHNIQGRVAAVSTRLQREQEIAHFDLNIDKRYSYTDVAVSGYGWREITLNIVPLSERGLSHAPEYQMQIKIKPGRRSDTGMPNSSPLVLSRPVYRVKLNDVTKISLTPSDKDGDLVRCREAQNVERGRLDLVPNVQVLPNCVVVISAFEQDGFIDGASGVVVVTLLDYTRRDMEQEGKLVTAFSLTPLSASVVGFMVEALANITVPEFVDPTPASQHVYTVYAGSQLFIPLYAKPSPDSPPDTVVTEFQLLSLPDHQMSAQPPVSDSSRTQDRVVKSALEWRTKDSDAGDYLIQAVAIDSDGFESQDRNFKIHVYPLRLRANPYFPFFPESGSVSCPQSSTCSTPIFAASGLGRNKIVSIEVVNQETNITGVETTGVEEINYRGQDVYRTDIRFTSDMVGDFSVCLKATDDHSLVGEECMVVQLTPPNPCDDMPCQNLGTCGRNGLSDYVCQCKPQYTGQHCETRYDQCSSNPCKNNSTGCIDLGVPGVACVCSEGWKGDFCEIGPDPCESSPCHNGGLCFNNADVPHEFICTCPAGYTGQNCSVSPAEPIGR